MADRVSFSIISEGRRREPSPEGNSFLFLTSKYGMRSLRCAICGQSLGAGASYRYDRYSTVVCTCHETDYCKICERLVFGQRVLIPGIGGACMTCGTPRTYQEVQQILNKIYVFFRERNIILPEYTVELLPAVYMIERYRDSFGFMPMGTAWDGDPSRPGSHKKFYKIDLMSQQSPTNMAKTLAHEMLHVWQYHNGIKAPKEYAEGFCNLASYEIMCRFYDSTDAMVALKHLMEDPDPAYGVAFRELKVLHDIKGWDCVVQTMLSFRN